MKWREDRALTKEPASLPTKLTIIIIFGSSSSSKSTLCFKKLHPFIFCNNFVGFDFADFDNFWQILGASPSD